MQGVISFQQARRALFQVNNKIVLSVILYVNSGKTKLCTLIKQKFSVKPTHSVLCSDYHSVPRFSLVHCHIYQNNGVNNEW